LLKILRRLFSPELLRGPVISVAVLLVLTEAMYLRPSVLAGSRVLGGTDFYQMHVRRMEFVRNALFGAQHALPGWYPYEFMGTPFSANLQSFPWIPTRLVLLLLDPNVAYGVGVALAATLAALFTYLFCRRAGLSQIGAVTAGWTFACSGQFVSRVLAGHLPVLEAYPALPLLLWLADRTLSPDRVDRQARDLLALAAASGCVALAGHPQVPAYALATALTYVIARGRGRQRLKAAGAMLLGLGTTLAAWWPMLLLIQRSTRVLHLAQADNDIALPYRRLLALIAPGFDGWAGSIELAAEHPFGGYPNGAYFWETTAYIGLFPLAVIAFLFVRSLIKKRVPAWPWGFLAAVGIGALILALPITTPLRNIIPGTLLRSPARLLYISTFSASVAVGFGVSAFLRSSVLTPRARHALVACCLLFHAFDLIGFGRLFVQTQDRQRPQNAPYQKTLAHEVRDGRIAVDQELFGVFNDRFDAATVFDSLLLASPYLTMVRLMGQPPDVNRQLFDASDLTLPALQASGVRFLVAVTPVVRIEREHRGDRIDLTLVDSSNSFADLYRVPDPAPRASFVSYFMAEYMPREKILDAFATQKGADRFLLLPEDARAQAPPIQGTAQAGIPAQVIYSRPSSDEIQLDTVTDQSGFVYLVEAYDPGWSAQVDGNRAPVVLANGFAMAIPATPGRHTIRLSYRTPGRTLGVVLSLLSACLLAGLVRTGRGNAGRSVCNREHD
jgi:hypothetical protein